MPVRSKNDEEKVLFMKKSSSLIWLLLVVGLSISSCTNKNKQSGITDKNTKPKATIQRAELSYRSEDNILYLFKDSSYQVRFRISGNYYSELGAYDGAGERNNSVLKFIYKTKGVEEVLFVDSLSCMSANFNHQDFNNDGIKDLEVFHFDGARANPRYYLYLVDQKDKKLTLVKGFEEIPNAELDSINNIIVGMALYGGDVDYSFHRISGAGKLVRLHKPVTDTVNGIKSETITRQIVKHWGKQ